MIIACGSSQKSNEWNFTSAEVGAAIKIVEKFLLDV